MGRVLEVIHLRRSIRRYDARPIPAGELDRILEAGRLAPSASNRQPWKFVVVTDPARRRQLAEAARGQAFIAEAPVVIVACGIERRTFGHGQFETWPVDLSIALDHMSLAAADEGIGTCWIGAFDPPSVKSILGIPEEVGVFMLMPFGYPAENPPARPRRTREEVYTFDRYQP